MLQFRVHVIHKEVRWKLYLQTFFIFITVAKDNLIIYPNLTAMLGKPSTNDRLQQTAQEPRLLA